MSSMSNPDAHFVKLGTDAHGHSLLWQSTFSPHHRFGLNGWIIEWQWGVGIGLYFIETNKSDCLRRSKIWFGSYRRACRIAAKRRPKTTPASFDIEKHNGAYDR